MRRGLLIVGVLLLLSVIPLYAAAPPTVGLSLSTLNNPFFVDLRDGAQAAAKKMNVNLVVVDAQNDSAREASQIEDLIQKKVAVIAINPTDSDAIVPTIKKINAARIPVITVDRGANGGVVAAHIASDNVAGGKREKEMFVVGFDAIGDALAAIKAGTMAATIAQQPKEMGRLAVENAVRIVKKQPVKKFTPVPLKLVTKQTM